MKEALYCLDRKEGGILVFENTDTLEILEIGAGKCDISLCEGDVVRIRFDDDGNALTFEVDTVETSLRKEKNRSRLDSLFDN